MTAHVLIEYGFYMRKLVSEALCANNGNIAKQILIHMIQICCLPKRVIGSHHTIIIILNKYLYSVQVNAL